MISKFKLEDYKVQKLIGRGSFGEILLVQRDGLKFAMKKISKKQIIKVNKMHEPFVERQILFKFTSVAPEYFVNLFETHSDNDYVYMMMEYCGGGSMESMISHLRDIENRYVVIKRIIIKMVMILEEMHKHGVIHRDIKPSNFLFLVDGTMKLADFGTAFAKQNFFSSEVAKTISEYRQISKRKQSQKSNQNDKDETTTDSSARRATFVGTPLYMAPQLLQEDFSGPQSDLWALGCIIYELIHEKPPFYDQNEGMVWKKILSDDYQQNIKIIQVNQQLSHYQSLIRALLTRERVNRLGYGQNGYAQIKDHPFFVGVDWTGQKNRPIKQLASYFEKKQSSAEKQGRILVNTALITNEEKILFSGAVSKKMFFGNFKQRMLVLHSTPKLVYFDMQTGEKKGELLLTRETPIGTEGSKIFTITNSKKTYYFKSVKSSQWVEMIKLAIITAFY